MVSRKKAILMGDKQELQAVYSDQIINTLNKTFDLFPRLLNKENYKTFINKIDETEVLFSTWGCPVLDETFLDDFNKLEAVFYAAGSTDKIVTKYFLNKGIVLSSAKQINAIPVAEYTLAQIILLLKNAYSLIVNENNIDEVYDKRYEMRGVYSAKIGIISYSQVGQELINLLENLKVSISVYDPYISKELLNDRGITKVPIEIIFEESDVIVVGTPLNNETRNMIDYRLLKKMKRNASIINIARGAIINTEDLVEHLTNRTDIIAVLDVTEPEPLSYNHPLLGLNNVIVTPHIAGSLGREKERLGDEMVDEALRYIRNETLKHAVYPI